MKEDLQDILSGNVPEPEAEEDPKGSEEAPEEESQGEAEEPRKEEESPEDSEDKQVHVPLAALKEERRKRQELEQRLKELELQRPEKSGDEPEDAAPDPLEDPEGYREWLKESVVKRELVELENRMVLQRYEVAKAEMLKKHPDFEAYETLAASVMQENPALIQRVRNALNPAEEVYRIGLQQLVFKEIGDPDELIQIKSLADEIRKAGGLEKWKEQFSTKIPSDLSAEPGGTKTAPAEDLDPSLEEILKTRR